MTTDTLSLARRLSDEELLAKVTLLAHGEREATVVLVAHLAVLDERRLYLAQGFSSMFTYCTQVLQLSEYAAYSRIEAARAARKFPVILNMLSSGTANLTTIGLVAPHITPENHRLVLEAISQKSKRQVEEIVARLRPLPLVPSSVRRLPAPTPTSFSSPTIDAGRTAGTAGHDSANGDAQEPGSSALVPVRSARVFAPPSVAPLAPESYRIQFTADADTCEQLRLAQDMLRHQIPDGDVGKIFARALKALLRELAKEKFAATDRPRKNATGRDQNRKQGSRHIPADVRRTVWLRDGGRCAFIARDGRRCVEKGRLEFHHVDPYARGGEATADNIELRCRAHNEFQAELDFALGAYRSAAADAG